MDNGKRNLELELPLIRVVELAIDRSGRTYGNSKYRGKLKFLAGELFEVSCHANQYWLIGMSYLMEGARYVTMAQKILNIWCSRVIELKRYGGR
jgi:hypothetical protein